MLTVGVRAWMAERIGLAMMDMWVTTKEPEPMMQNTEKTIPESSIRFNQQ